MEEQILKPKNAPRKNSAAAKEKKMQELDAKILAVAESIKVKKAPPVLEPVAPEPVAPEPEQLSEPPVKAPRKKKVIQIVQLESDSDSEVELVMPKPKKVVKKVVAREPEPASTASEIAKKRAPPKPKEPKVEKPVEVVQPVQQISRIKFL